VVTELGTGTTKTIRSQYLLACDGATSAVREQLGVAMEGRLLSYSVNVLI
jgi:2-polyprenyl-6-methoxyphenol hydroxylase-like FAD-dependent oxidoreductase